MKEISRMERKTEKGHLNGQLASGILEVGEMENNMGLAYCIIRKKDQRSKESGKTERESGGFKVQKCLAHRPHPENKESEMIIQIVVD